MSSLKLWRQEDIALARQLRNQLTAGLRRRTLHKVVEAPLGPRHSEQAALSVLHITVQHLV